MIYAYLAIFCNKIYGFYSLKIITLWNFNRDFIANGNLFSFDYKAFKLGFIYFSIQNPI